MIFSLREVIHHKRCRQDDALCYYVVREVSDWSYRILPCWKFHLLLYKQNWNRSIHSKSWATCPNRPKSTSPRTASRVSEVSEWLHLYSVCRFLAYPIRRYLQNKLHASRSLFIHWLLFLFFFSRNLSKEWRLWSISRYQRLLTCIRTKPLVRVEIFFIISGLFNYPRASPGIPRTSPEHLGRWKTRVSSSSAKILYPGAPLNARRLYETRAIPKTSDGTHAPGVSGNHSRGRVLRRIRMGSGVGWTSRRSSKTERGKLENWGLNEDGESRIFKVWNCVLTK